MLDVVLLPSSRVMQVRDEQHALTLLGAAGHMIDEARLRELDPDEQQAAPTFEVVDPDNRPFAREYGISREGSELAAGSLGRRVAVDTGLSPPLTLELRALRPAVLGGG